MHHYIVLDTTDDGKIALRDDRRRYHVARLHADVPPSGERLQGNAPGLGFSLLLSLATGKIYRVTFEHADCGQERALALIHPETTVPAFFLAELRAAAQGGRALDHPTGPRWSGARALLAEASRWLR